METNEQTAEKHAEPDVACSAELGRGVRGRPMELNEHTRWILGRPNFACIGIANRLRELGHAIERKSEDEQAVVIHWMLTMYEQHGENWRDAAERYLKAA